MRHLGIGVAGVVLLLGLSEVRGQTYEQLPEYRRMHSCVEDWEQYARRFQDDRARAAQEKAQGRDPWTHEFMNKQHQQYMMARFVPKCGKYGFEFARDEAGEKRNDAVMREVQRKSDSLRVQAEAADQRKRDK